MANFQNLLDSIASVIHQNGNQEITGEVLKSTLQSMVSVLGANATFGGIAHIADNPGTPDGPVVYIASDVGTYPNFGALEILTDELAVFVWNPTAGTWTKESITYIADKSEIEELIQQGIEDINDAKTEALNEIGQIVQNVDVTYETIEGNNVQLKNGQGNLLIPKTNYEIVDCGGESLIEILGGDATIEAHDVRVGYWDSSLTFVSSSGSNQKCGIFDVVGGRTYYVKYRNDIIRYTAWADDNGNRIGSNIRSSSASTEKAITAPDNATKLYISNVYDAVSKFTARFTYSPQFAPISVVDDVADINFRNRLENENIIKVKTTSLNVSYSIFDFILFFYNGDRYELVMTINYTSLWKNGVNVWSSAGSGATIYKGAYVDGKDVYLAVISSANVLSFVKLDVITNQISSLELSYTITSVAYNANNCLRFVDYNNSVYAVLSRVSDGVTNLTPALYQIDFVNSEVTLIGTLTSKKQCQPCLFVKDNILYILALWREDRVLYQYDGTTLSVSDKSVELQSRQNYVALTAVRVIDGVPYFFDVSRCSKVWFDNTFSSTSILNISSFLALESGYPYAGAYAFAKDGDVEYMSVIGRNEFNGNNLRLYTYALREGWIAEIFNGNGKDVGFVNKLSDLKIGETAIVPYVGENILQVTTGEGTGVRNWYYTWGKKDLMRVTKTNADVSHNIMYPVSRGECKHIYQPYRADKRLNLWRAGSYRGTGMSKYGDSIWMAVTARPILTNADYTWEYGAVCRTLNGGISFINQSKALVPDVTTEGSVDAICAIDGGTTHKGRLWAFADKITNITASFDAAVYGIIAQYSDDNGATWSDIVDLHEIIWDVVDTTNLIDDRIGTTGGITLSNGTVVIMAELHYSDKYLPFPLYTTDGVNWQVGSICNTESAETAMLEKDGYLYITCRTDTNIRSGWNNGTRTFWRIPISNLASGTWERVDGVPPISYANGVTVGFGYCDGVWLMSCPSAASRNNITLYKSKDLTTWVKVEQLTVSSKGSANLAGYSSMLFEKDMLRVTLEDQYYNILMYDLDYLLPDIFKSSN